MSTIAQLPTDQLVQRYESITTELKSLQQNLKTVYADPQYDETDQLDFSDSFAYEYTYLKTELKLILTELNKRVASNEFNALAAL